MNQLFANRRPRMLQRRTTLIKRNLVGEGVLNVVKNQEISPQDILGHFTSPVGFLTVNVARKLEVSPKEVIKYLVRSQGKVIFKGELLASKKSWLGKKIVISPTDGVVDTLNGETGDLKIKFLPKKMPIASGVYGIVESVNSATGEVVIKTLVTEVYGMMGSGKERGGILSFANKNTAIIDSSAIKPEFSQHVVVAQGLIYSRALKKAISVGVNAVLAGGINAEDYISIAGSLDPRKRIGSEIGLSLLISEGFGPLQIGNDIMREVALHEGRYVFLDGNKGMLILPSRDPNSILILRKTAVPPHSSARGMVDIVVGELELNANIRIVGAPYLGVQGKILAIDKTPSVLESGITTILVTVETPSRKIKVPYTNIELL